MANFVCEIILVREETHDVKTFRLVADKQLNFIPGQYALFSIPKNEKFSGEKRPFTFSSSPTERDFFEITVKKVGEFTTAMHP